MRLLYSEPSSDNLFERPVNMRRDFSEAVADQQQVASSIVGMFQKNNKSSFSTSNVNSHQFSVNNCFDITETAMTTTYEDGTTNTTTTPQKSKRFSKRFSQSFGQRSSEASYSCCWESYGGIVDQAALIVGDALRSNPSSKGSTPCGSPSSPAINTSLAALNSSSSRRKSVNEQPPPPVEVNYIKVSPKKLDGPTQDDLSCSSSTDASDSSLFNVTDITIPQQSSQSSSSLASSPTSETVDSSNNNNSYQSFASVFSSSSKGLKRLSNGAAGLIKNKLDLFVSKASTTLGGGQEDFYVATTTTGDNARLKSVSLPPPLLKTKTSQSAPQLEYPSATTSFDELDDGEDSKKTSSSDFNETTKIINNFSNIETIIDDLDGRKIVRDFMKKRCNEELLLYLEVVRTFKKIKVAAQNKQQNSSNNGNGGTPAESPRVTSLIHVTNATSLSFEFLKMKEFQLVHNQFISLESSHCINVDHSIRDTFSQLYKELLLQDFSEETVRIMHPRLTECLDMLYITISLQFKNEIFPQFKRTDEYKDLLLRRVVERIDVDAFNPEEASIETLLSKLDMKDYSKKFKKKKLETLGQIQNYSTDNFKKLGISKLGHLKRITKAVKDHFSRSEELKKSFSYSIFQQPTPSTPQE